ncbi:MFS family permease [Microbacterium sp. ZKA21]|uniref:MFS transporter n=1 Tax=Microbacterium sp. ZKA21 TaxID=3381694 RepID=UPI003D223158
MTDASVRAPRRVGGPWLTFFAIAWLAVWTAQLTPIQLLLPLQLDTPGGKSAWVGGVVWSGLILSVGGMAGVIAGPIAGALSDRTASRWGRRRPWVLSGSVLTAASLVLTGLQTEPMMVGAAWIGVSIGIAVTSAALTALIADQIDEQRGAASALVSSAQAVGIVVGVGAVVLLGLGILEGYLVLAGFMLIVGIGAALLLPDPFHAESGGVESRRDRWGALRDHDFRWLLAGRLAVNIGNALGTALLLFFVLYGIGSPAATAEDDLLLLIVIYTVFVVAASLLAGRISDRSGRRRTLVIGSALVQALSAIMILAAPTFLGTAIAAAVMGIGYGAYMSVSLALATDLLPDGLDSARDLGVVNVSASLGQLLGPLIGAGLVAAMGGFWLLFAAAGALSVVGAVMTAAVRPARESRRPDPAVR